MKASLTALLATAAMLLCTWAAAEPPQEQKIKLDIAAQSMEQALNAFAEQTGFQLLFRASEVPASLLAPRLAGTYTPRDALKQLLANTPLNYEFINDRTVAIRAANAGEADPQRTSIMRGEENFRLARIETGQPESRQKVASASTENEKRTVKSPTASETTDDETSKGTPEILVKGKRSLNADIERTEDAPQPYVVFDSKEIQRAQAVNLEDFLRTRLPMNTASSSSSQATGNGSVTLSSINLRGLGANQTLILVDGRRMPSVATSGVTSQPDLNGIPLAAIERIEVLPSTAGGIYGGSATGGVINVILRRNFQGLDAKATYANAFDTDAANLRLDVTAGFSLEGGRTQVMIAATRSDANNLVVGDRDFAARAIALQLTNNPSAITGSSTPPLGATVNIRSVSGNLVLDPAYGATPLGSNITHIPLGYAGPASDSGAALRANAGQYNLDLPGGMVGRERGLIAVPSMDSVSLNVRRGFGQRLEAFLDFSRLGNGGDSFGTASPFAVPNSVLNLPASAPNNPFQQAINVRFPTSGLSFGLQSESTTVRGTGGLIARLPHNWTGEVDYGWSRSHFMQIFTGSSAVDSVATCVLGRGVAASIDPDGSGPLIPCATGDSRPALNALQETSTFPIDFTPYLLPSADVAGPSNTILQDLTLRITGPAVNLPAGPLNLSAVIERREERIEDSFYQSTNSTTRAATYSFYPDRSQNADSYYLEARAPLISRQHALRLVRELELQVSARRDAYKTLAAVPSSVSVSSRDGPLPAVNYITSRLSSTDYTLGLRYAPLEDMTLRASFGTGFLPPSLLQIAPVQVTSTANVGTDPKRGNTNMYVGIPYTRIAGGNPALEPEHSESWSVGIILTPHFASDFRLSIDYTRIEKGDEIQSPASQFLLDNEDGFPGRIVRGANLAADPPGWAGPITSFDITYLNIAKTVVEAYDIQADYVLETERFGGFHGYVVATMEPHYENQLLPTASVVDRAGFTGGPLEWRGNLGLDWDNGPLTLSWNGQYYDSYWVYTATATAASIATAVLNQGSTRIPRQIYHDLIATYRFDAAVRLLANSEVSLGIQNLFDESPPILASADPLNVGYSTYGDPRLRRYSLSIRKNFGN